MTQAATRGLTRTVNQVMTQARRRPRWSIAVAAAVVVVVVLAVSFTARSCSAQAGDGVPYTDSRSVGQMTLFNAAGQPITSGSIHTAPFVGYAVSLQRAPKPYDGKGGKATLMAYQPRAGIDPSRWGGDFISGSSAYSDPNHPTVALTNEDLSLAQFLAEYPSANSWDNLIQLRIFLGVPGQATLNTSYVTADIRVSGDTWTLVRGGSSVPGGLPRPVPGQSGP
jgi:hypothetical protein